MSKKSSRKKKKQATLPRTFVETAVAQQSQHEAFVHQRLGIGGYGYRRMATRNKQRGKR